MSRGTKSRVNELVDFSNIFEQAKKYPFAEQHVKLAETIQKATFLPTEASQADLQSARKNLLLNNIEPKVTFLKSGQGIMVYGDKRRTTSTKSKIEPITPWLS